ncbi:MAG: ATP-binding protein [Candidatus Eremiobacterota bacterium]
MKILEIEIHNMRGIRDLVIKPEGKSLVIWGPNGSGKSGIVDALDFLLTGQITRLTGKGTGKISLHKHGPHIDSTPDDASIRAVIKLKDIDKKIEIKRCLNKPTTLEYNDNSIKPLLDNIITIAKQGQHVLTRRELLKYITAENSTRAQEIQQLLNITEIEDIRKSLVTAHNNLAKDCDSAKKIVDKEKRTVNATVQEKSFNKDIIGDIINQNRTLLAGKPLTTFCYKNLKIGLTPIITTGPSVNITLFEKDVQNIRKILLPQHQEQIKKADEQMRDLINTIQLNPDLIKSMKMLDLTRLGINLIDKTGNCPLCDTSWPPGKLLELLEKRLKTAQTALKYQKAITDFSSNIKSSSNFIIASLKSIINITQTLPLQKETSLLQAWLDKLENFVKQLNNPVENYTKPSFNLNQVQTMLAPDDIEKILTCITLEINNKFPKTTPEQTAWDTLTKLEENLKALEDAENILKNAELNQKKASVLLKNFEQARNTILEKLYEEIKDNFINLYRKLHEDDENNFKAKLEPDGAGLSLEVDFYGRGIHPPNALHSEGHQDSMGLCLYLSLSKKLTQDLLDLVILDDVVMSVDADHRRQICHILKKFFPEKQFIITTHDRVWRNQLKFEGMVKSNEIIEFYKWDVETGPYINYKADMWERIKKDIEQADIASASHKLRRGSEEFFSMVCNALQVPVKYKSSMQWELGDLLPPAISQYKKLLKQAKDASQSWKQHGELEKLNQLDEKAKEIFNRSNIEQWAMNPNVHYNSWTTFSEHEFRPLIEVFQELFNLFLCPECGILSLTTKGTELKNVCCNCGKTNWNLTKKTK